MHRIFAIFIVFFTAWTFAVQMAMLTNGNMFSVFLIFPVMLFALAVCYKFLSNRKAEKIKSRLVISSDRGAKSNSLANFFLVGIFILVTVLVIDWKAFWFVSVIYLTALICYKPFSDVNDEDVKYSKFAKEQKLIVFFTIALSVLLTLYVSRSDLDDAFYASISASINANPSAPILATDYMFAEEGLPILFPSYKFTSFEVLSGALAYILGVPAVTVYYVYIPAVLAVFIVLVTFLLSKELMPRSWHWLGLVAIGLIFLLGETPRSPANFHFFRIFQGKAAFVSIVLPGIFYFSMRYFKPSGSRLDLFLLGCCQICAIGFSNYGMVAAPIATICAFAANTPLLFNSYKKLLISLTVLLIPAPYLIYVLTQLKNTVLFSYPTEASYSVWITVFGQHQQYLFAFLLLIGPLVVQNRLLAFRLAIPTLILFGILLNPYLADFISQKIVRPEVYWRVIWSFPILIYCSVALVSLFDSVKNRRGRLYDLAACLCVILIIAATPFNTFRKDNASIEWQFAGLKIPKQKLEVARRAIDLNSRCCKVLAPTEISGIISRFENHPKLIMTRTAYLDVLAKHFGEQNYRHRHALQNFVSCGVDYKLESIAEGLKVMKVDTIVMQQSCVNDTIDQFIVNNGFLPVSYIYEYTIYFKGNPSL